MHSILLLILLTAICGGCATTTPDTVSTTPARTTNDVFYGEGYTEVAPATETAALGSCEYGISLPGWTDVADVHAQKGMIVMQDGDLIITVQLTRAAADFEGVTDAVYKHVVNSVPAPFYAWPIGATKRAPEAVSFGFGVRKDGHEQGPVTRGVTHLHQNPASGHVIVFTAVWPMNTTDAEREARMLAIASQQTLSCS